MADGAPVKPKTCGRDVEVEWLSSAYLEYAPGLRRFVVGVLRDPAAAEDVVQATFAKATAAAGAIEPEAIKAWLYRVALHEALTCKRRSGVAQRATQELSDRLRRGMQELPEDTLVRRETVEQVREAVHALSANQQQVLRARVYQEKTFAQIAVEMGLPLGTVLTHMRRALDKLRQKLRGNE